MTTEKQAPILGRVPEAPREYEVAAFDAIIRTLEDNFRLLTSVTLLRGSGIFLIDPPTSGYQLRVGSVFVDGNGVLRMIQEGDMFTGAISAAGAVGSVTATTP